jgi:Flp pilus assembly protein TadG
MSRCSRRKQLGSVAVFLAIGLVAMVACLGAAVDIGRLSMIKTHMQSAGDLAATGSASSCHTTADTDLWAQTASLCAENFAGSSGTAPTPQFVRYLTSGTTNVGAVYTIGSDTVTVTHPYSDSYTNSLGYAPEDLVRVDLTTTSRLLLLPIIGIRSATVTTRSVAVCLTGGPLLIFAHSTDPTVYALDWSSSSCTINGDTHSNTMVDMSGSDDTINGWIDYRNGYSLTGTHDALNPGFRVGNVLNYPIPTDPASYGPYDYIINKGMWNFTGSIPGGVYYCKGDVHVNSTDTPAGPITIIAAGKIHINGSITNWQAAHGNVLFMSLSPLGLSGGYCIDINAQGGVWNGIIFAPNGDINFTASGQTMYNGGILAEEVSLGGQNFTASGVLPPIPRDNSRLLE